MSPVHDNYEMIQQGRVLVIRFRRDVFEDEKIRQMQDSLRTLVAGMASPMIVLDLCNVRHVGSSFLGTVMDVTIKITRKGGKACICGMTPQVADLMALTRLDQIVPIRAGADEAVRGLEA